MNPDIAFLESIAREAGEILLRHRGRLERVDKKGARDLVTDADRESERHLIGRIREAFPAHTILAEETLSEARLGECTWILDPLDGTTNFVYGIPHYAVSVAFHAGGEPRLACVFNPHLDECFVAEAGGGARRNGVGIACREEVQLSESLLVTGFAYRREEKADSNLRHFTDLSYRTRDIRRLGAAALDLCYVAQGMLDGFWELHLAPWDVAAGGLIAREAGCAVSDFRGGGEWLFGGEIVAANPALSERIREVLLAADASELPGPRYRS